MEPQNLSTQPAQTISSHTEFSHPRIKIIVFSLLFLLLGLVGGFYFGMMSLRKVSQSYKIIPTVIPTGVSCTLEAKLCPDGSSVGRSGPNCEFAPCPSGVVSPAQLTSWKTYENKKFGYEINYPDKWNLVEAKPRIGMDLEWTGNILGNDEVQKTTFITTEHKNFQFAFEVKVSSNSAGLSLDQWKNKTLEGYKSATGHSLIRFLQTVKLGGIDSYEFSTFGFDSKDTIVGTIKNNFVYEIRFNSSNPNDPDFDTHSEIYKQMLSSFTFLN